VKLLIPSVSAASGVHPLADWLELKALASDDGNSSMQDLIAEMRRDGSTDAVDDSEESVVDARGDTSERIASDAFSEIEERSHAAGSGYPFEVSSQSIQLIDHANDNVGTYLFLLLLSQFGVDAAKGVGVRPERGFEHLSLEAARSYFGHNEHDGSYHFGFPRLTKAAGFSDAVDDLAKHLGEGGGAKLIRPAAQQKDAHLDLVVWHGFADQMPGQLIAFGQCAAGANWRTKITELPSGHTWCQAWMLDPPAVPPARMLFIPHRLDRSEFQLRSTLGGVLFERCRIAFHAPNLPDVVAAPCKRWAKAAIEKNVRL